MKVREISLVSPSGSQITGFLTTSGSVCPVKCRFSRNNGENNFFFEVPVEMMDELADNDGDRICVDQNGAQWSTTDVMRESAPRGA